VNAIPTEMELLISCARVHLGSGQPEQIKEGLRQKVDWPYLLRLARKHRFRPLLYQHLNRTSAEAVPVAVLSQLQERFQENLRRNLRLTRELFNLLSLFKTEEIHAVPYKGPALALSFFGSLALREFTDLDIVVSATDIVRATSILRASGYQPQFQFGSAQEVSFFHHQCEHRFHHRDKQIYVDIHWRFAPRYFSFEPGPLRDRLQTLSLSGREMQVYSPEDQFLLLSVHASKHLWDRLLWICDLAQLVRVQSGLDWDAILSRARESGAERMTLLGVFLAHDVLGASFPSEVLKRACSDRSVKLLAERVQNQLGMEEDARPGILAESLFHLRARERKRDRFQYCFRLAVTPTGIDWSLLRLPAALSPLYYAIRPLRLAVKHGLGSTRGIDWWLQIAPSVFHQSGASDFAAR
jgi:hypothetical protein